MISKLETAERIVVISSVTRGCSGWRRPAISKILVVPLIQSN